MDNKLIDKFYKGKCTPEEVREVLNWFKSFEPGPEQEQGLFDNWKEANQYKTDSLYAHDSKKIWAKIEESVNGQGKATEKFQSTGEEMKDRTLSHWIREHRYKVAAAVLLPLFFLSLFLYNFSRGENPGIQFATVEASFGVKKVIALGDGSVITLNSGSKVTYPIQFPLNKREITLYGEAFFEVAKDSLRPFIVRSGAISTHALGTSFNIKYRSEDETIAVALATGSVKVEREEQKNQNLIATLTPGKRLVYSKINQQHQVEDFNSREVLAWKEGTLYFKKANLEQVIMQLEYWYGVDIEIAGKVPAESKVWNYSGEYKRESLDTVLEGISFVKHFSYQRKNEKVIIRFYNN